MRSLSASDLSIEVVGGVRRLRFAASLANVGPGPLLLLPAGTGECRTGQHEAVQVLHRDRNRDGVFQRARDRQGSRRATGCMLRHSGHDHWHFDAMAAYSLRRPAHRTPCRPQQGELLPTRQPAGSRPACGRPTAALRKVLAQQPAGDLTRLGGRLQGGPVRTVVAPAQVGGHGDLCLDLRPTHWIGSWRPTRPTTRLRWQSASTAPECAR